METHYNSKERFWSGPEYQFLYDPKVSVGEMLLQSLNKYSSQVGQILHDDRSEMTNGEIAQYVIRAALNLKDLKLKEGDVIGVAAKNSKFLASVVIGAFTLGTPINAIDPSFEKEAIMHMFKITEPKLVLCDKENLGEIQEALTEIQSTALIYVFECSEDDVPSGAHSVHQLLREHPVEKSFIPPPISDATTLPAAIVCSSGTTGPSKGVSLSHVMVNQLFEGFVGNQKSLLNFSSLYWITGLITLVSTTYKGITRIITLQPFSPRLLIDIIKTHKLASVMSSPTFMLTTLKSDLLLEDDLDSINIWALGGSYVSEDSCLRLNTHLKNGRAKIMYGLAEAGALISQTTEKYKTVGQLCKGMLVKVIDEQGNHLGPGERGEICLRTGLPIQGYYRNPKATNLSLINDWFHSGDIGFMDHEGNLSIVDRERDVMKVIKYYVDPSEIEKLIEKIPGVVLVTVFGLPDELVVDLPAAIVVKSKGSKLTENYVKLFVENNMPEHKWLTGGVYFMDKLPTTPSGKITKRKCRDMVLELLQNKIV